MHKDREGNNESGWRLGVANDEHPPVAPVRKAQFRHSVMVCTMCTAQNTAGRHVKVAPRTYMYHAPRITLPPTARHTDPYEGHVWYVDVRVLCTMYMYSRLFCLSLQCGTANCNGTCTSYVVLCTMYKIIYGLSLFIFVVS